MHIFRISLDLILWKQRHIRAIHGSRPDTRRVRDMCRRVHKSLPSAAILTRVARGSTPHIQSSQLSCTIAPAFAFFCAMKTMQMKAWRSEYKNLLCFDVILGRVSCCFWPFSANSLAWIVIYSICAYWLFHGNINGNWHISIRVGVVGVPASLLFACIEAVRMGWRCQATKTRHWHKKCERIWIFPLITWLS